MFDAKFTASEENRLFKGDDWLGRNIATNRIVIPVDRQELSLRILVNDQLPREDIDPSIYLLKSMMQVLLITHIGTHTTKLCPGVGETKETSVNIENRKRILQVLDRGNRKTPRTGNQGGKTCHRRAVNLQITGSRLSIIDNLSTQRCSQNETCGQSRNEPEEGHHVPPFMVPPANPAI